MKTYMDIVDRVILTLTVIGFMSSLMFWKKGKIFKDIGYCSFLILTVIGLVEAISTVIFGF